MRKRCQKCCRIYRINTIRLAIYVDTPSPLIVSESRISAGARFCMGQRSIVKIHRARRGIEIKCQGMIRTRANKGEHRRRNFLRCETIGNIRRTPRRVFTAEIDIGRPAGRENYRRHDSNMIAHLRGGNRKT